MQPAVYGPDSGRQEARVRLAAHKLKPARLHRSAARLVGGYVIATDISCAVPVIYCNVALAA